jgi:predicted PurR-regulated permease PerM
MMQRVAASIAAVLTTLLALVVLWQFHVVVIYVLISLALAAALRPLGTHLEARGFVARLAWILLYLVALGCLGFLFFLAGETILGEIQLLGRTVSAQDAWQLPLWLEGSPFQLALVAQLPPPSKLFEALAGDQGQRVLPAIRGFSQGIGGIVSGTFIILFLSIYWSIHQIHFERLWLSLLPPGQRKQARGIWRTIETNLGAYIRSEVLQSFLAALLLGIGYWLLGSPYPSLLALVGALVWLIPVVGALVAVILPLLLGLLTGVQLSLMTAVYTLIVLFVLQAWVEPRLFKRKWDNPILTMVILLAMADAFGLIGILVAPPLSAVCQILWNLEIAPALARNQFVNHTASGADAQVFDLKERQAHVWKFVNAMDGPPIALITSSMERLTQLIEKAEPVLQASLPVSVPGETAESTKS